MTYKMVSTPVSYEDADEMWQCIQEAHSVATLLSMADENKDLDPCALPEIGKVIVRLLSQPMECSTYISNEKEAAAEGTVIIDAAFLSALDDLHNDVTDAGVLLAGVPGEKEELDRQDRAASVCINAACRNLDTIFDVVGKPNTRREQSAANQ